MTELRQGPLHSRHIALGAKMGAFGGWDMPIEYPAGTVAEHTAVRERVGIFDVSHMGKVRVYGDGAKEFLNSMFANDIDRITPGKAQYSMLCNDQGGIVDDLIVYYVAPDEVRFIPNAGNADEVVRILQAALPSGLRLENRHFQEGIIAVQGPRSEELVTAIGLPIDLEYMAFADAKFAGESVTVCRTGYTGEVGFEIVAPVTIIGALWDELLAKGESFGVLPAGLGARDTLRTEMGYVLHGQDISPSITPVEARTGWAVGWGKSDFRGKAALAAMKEAGAPRLAWGLLAQTRGIPRSHMQVLNSDGKVVGETTSGTFSPTLQQGIALALLDRSVAEGDLLSIDVRGRALEVKVVKPPFVHSAPK